MSLSSQCPNSVALVALVALVEALSADASPSNIPVELAAINLKVTRVTPRFT